MRRVLVLAYHFPPIGGAGVQRTVKFIRHLPSFGYLPNVVTGPGTSHWMPIDDALAGEVSEDVAVVRVREEEPASSSRWSARAGAVAGTDPALRELVAGKHAASRPQGWR